MERNGASHRITTSRSQQSGEQPRGMRPANQWSSAGGELYSHEDSLALSVSRHPSGGYNADVANHSWDPQDPDRFRAGPFRTPNRAQVAAEALGERTRTADGGEIDRYRRSRYS